MVASAATMQYTDENNITWNFTIKSSTSHTVAFGDGTNAEDSNGTSGSKMFPAENIPWEFTENRKIHVALPTGGRYQIRRNGLSITVK